MAGHSPASLLDSYHAEREPVARAVLRTTDRFTRTATIRNPLAQTMRNALLSLLGRSEAVKRHTVADLAELTISYANSPIVQDDWKGWPKAGKRAPDGRLQPLASPDTIRLYEVLRETRHTLLLFLGTRPTLADRNRLADLATIIRDRYPGQIVLRFVVTRADTLTDGLTPEEVLCDVDGVLHQRYSADTACLYLVRPDGYIGFRGVPARIDRLQKYLSRIFFEPRGSTLREPGY